MKRVQIRGLALIASCALLLPAISACGAGTESTTTGVPAADATATVAAGDTAPGAIVTMTATEGAGDMGTGTPASMETPTEAAMMSPTAGGAAGGAANSPEAVVQAFYSWYVRFSGNPFTSGSPEMTQYVTPELIARLANPAKGTPGMAVDPFVCAQNPPVS